MKVKLSRAEISLCHKIASGRTQISRLTNVYNQRRDDSRTDNDIDYLGAKAELAVAKLFKIDFDASVLGVDDGTDMYHGNVSIDVKSTFHQGGQMLFKSLSNFKADVCVLATEGKMDNEIEVIGWLPLSLFKERCKPFRPNEKSVAVPQKNLLPLTDLWHGLMTKSLNGD